MRTVDTAIYARVARWKFKVLYPTAKNKVLRVVSSYFEEVLRFIRKKIKLKESVDVPEVVDFRQQQVNKFKWIEVASSVVIAVDNSKRLLSLRRYVLQDLLVPADVLIVDMTGHCWPASVGCCVDT